MKACIINYASGAWYPAGQRRLVESLNAVGSSVPVHLYTRPEELGCPPHQQVPYGFKPYALQRAFESGYELVLWCDASVWAIKSLIPVWEYLAEHSHLFFHNANIGRFTSDACLAGFGLSRDDAMKLSGLMGICMGFNWPNRSRRSSCASGWPRPRTGSASSGRGRTTSIRCPKTTAAPGTATTSPWPASSRST